MSDTAKLFRYGNSQAVELPKEFHFSGDEVRIRRQDSSVILEPILSGWQWLDEIAGNFSSDFFATGRRQPALPQ